VAAAVVVAVAGAAGAAEVESATPAAETGWVAAAVEWVEAVGWAAVAA
jgi:hypothetical protein